MPLFRLLQVNIMRAALILCLSLLIVQPCSALYRCNGRVQQTPCETSIVGPQGFGTARMPKPHRPNNQRKYAKVIISEFEFLPKSEGIWRGRVAGNGRVHLHLKIKKDGVLESTRYMGNVQLADKSTTFAFRSVTPSGNNWSWDIVASNG